MPDFFSKMKDGLSKGTQILSVKSSSFIESNRVSTELSNLKKAKHDAFAALGKKVYDAKDAFSIDQVLEDLNALAEFDVNIDAKEKELQEIKLKEESAMDNINKAPEAGDENAAATEEVVEEEKEDEQ